MTSNQANGVTSPTKVKDLAGLFSAAPAAPPAKKPPQRTFALGKSNLLIQEKDASPAQLTSPTKSSNKVGELAKSVYHHPHPAPPRVTTVKPIVTTAPVATRSVSRLETIPDSSKFVNGSSIPVEPKTPSTPVKITAWEDSKAEEYAQSESVRTRAARMNSQPDTVEVSKSYKPPSVTSKLTTVFHSSLAAVSQEKRSEPEPIKRNEDFHQPSISMEIIHHQEEEDDHHYTANTFAEQNHHQDDEEHHMDNEDDNDRTSRMDNEVDDDNRTSRMDNENDDDNRTSRMDNDNTSYNTEATYEEGLYSSNQEESSNGQDEYHESTFGHEQNHESSLAEHIQDHESEHEHDQNDLAQRDEGEEHADENIYSEDNDARSEHSNDNSRSNDEANKEEDARSNGEDDDADAKPSEDND